MALSELVGKTYGPRPYRTCQEKVAEYVDATRDDSARWSDAAPPSLAGSLLFVVAPLLLSDPDAASQSQSVIHGDQSFEWHGSIPIEADLAVSGTVTRVRERGGVAFVAFDLVVEDEGRPLIEGSSTFLMSGGAARVEEGDEEPEPEVTASGPNGPLARVDPNDPLPPLERSASRADLVRYAAASRDWNPIHWDHRSAVEAGLPGVVAHGLLQTAWMCQSAARLVEGPAPLAAARFRFRSPLRPGIPAIVSGELGEESTVKLALEGDGATYATGTIELVR